MIRVECPIGCAGYLRRPFGVRQEPAQCPNCTAWYRVAAEVEDGALVTGVLMASPGVALLGQRQGTRLARRAPARRGTRLFAPEVALYAALAAALVLALVAGGPGALAAAAVAYGAGVWRRVS